ncbi:molecular chaperone DnaJ [Roseomonas nepalensis]|uniref:Molecular chaperone DnaJ n=1 Tax=Muricoccus nepalensis TaxID=1854500 RepID=A0A502GC81_9PROT|nr:molecular chaperone DnaJ [Roseomonas nepalensis]TPG59098.1 molecular chaperone DnaJ [Roseomonas nepalensis]
MIWLAAGAILLLLAAGGLRAFSAASVGQVKTVLAGTAAALGLVVVAVVLVAGRAGQLFWALALFGPMAWRWWKARQPPGGFGGAAPDLVETAMLSMRLDPASGTLSGRVLRGRWAGRDLAELDLAALRALRAEAAADDPESVPLVEAWLDRSQPGWREADGEAPAGPDAPPRAEALAILGLSEGATEAEIRAAHARLMRAAHPDAGGSDWLAARLNAARDALLG